MDRKVIIVSNRLPVTVSKTEEELSFKPSTGGLATGLSSVYQEGNNLWIGWPGLQSNNPDEQKQVTQALRKDNMAPVFLTQQDIEEYYEGFSNSTIWPLFHYFPEFAEYNYELWEAYKRVNEQFCKQILQHASSEDIIWVHDYQLLLLPQMLRKELPNATIGFFQHIPFPSYEIFRLFPWRLETLEGMLGADLIGFHTYDDMRHFLSSVSRIVGVGHTMGQIRMDDRLLAVDAFPMGIDYEKFEKAATSKETKQELKEYKKIFDNQKVILSIDRLDYSKGIKQRLNAFDLFLEQYPEYIGKVSLLLIVVPSRDQVDQYQQLKEEIDTLVGRLDGKYSRIGWTPIHYFYRSFSFHSLSAMYSNAEVALITPLRDGMNLVCKEYIASKADKKGVLILSEMAGAAKELSEAILINPNDEHKIVEAMFQALTMPQEEQIARNTEMQTKLKRYNVYRWVEVFMQQLEEIKEQQKRLNMRMITDSTLNKTIDQYKKAKKSILFLDYDGTLRPFVKNPQQAYPDPELHQLIQDLCAIPKNRVVIISGRDRHTLDKWLGQYNIDIIAEHGVWLREDIEGTPTWRMIDDLDQAWKEKIHHILELYVDRTPGAFIEDKDYSLVWHYRKADTDFGELRARELSSNISYLISNMNLQIMDGNKVLEIKNRDVNKGKAARKFLMQEEYDFVLAVGDDVTDEDTFEAMPPEAYTFKVGLTTSAARFNIRSPREVRRLLKRILDTTT